MAIRPESFKRSEMTEMADELARINKSLEDMYVLVTAGRLGSSDKWLGIPCSWSQISKARVIVETGLEELQAEPSEGSHFFQNVTSLGCLYLTNNPIQGEGKYDYEEIRKLPLVEETKHFIHVRSERDLLIKADGSEGKAVVMEDKTND